MCSLQISLVASTPQIACPAILKPLIPEQLTGLSPDAITVGCKARSAGRKQKGRNGVQPVLPNTLSFIPWEAEKKVAGWVARTRPLAEPLSPRGPQPVLQRLRTLLVRLNGSAEPLERVPE